MFFACQGVRTAINATTVFSFWPEVLKNSNEFPVLQKEGCLINSDLGGLAIDPTTPKCRGYIWDNFLKPRYFDKGTCDPYRPCTVQWGPLLSK